MNNCQNMVGMTVKHIALSGSCEISIQILNEMRLHKANQYMQFVSTVSFHKLFAELSQLKRLKLLRARQRGHINNITIIHLSTRLYFACILYFAYILSIYSVYYVDCISNHIRIICILCIRMHRHSFALMINSMNRGGKNEREIKIYVTGQLQLRDS